MSTSMEVDFAGIHLTNPFILASAPPTTSGEMIQRAFDEGWGGAVIKTLTYDTERFRNVSPRIHAVRQDGKVIGFSNFELGSQRSIDVWLEEIVGIKKKYPAHRLFASLLHTEGLVKNQWVGVVKRCDEAGVDGFELNFSCSHGMAEGGGGATIAGNVDLMRKVLGWVRIATKLPIMVKLPAFVDDLPRKALIVKENGADAISAINTISSLSGVDIYNFTPLPQVDGKSAYGGLSGPAIKCIGLRCVAQISKEVDIPISGMGGITNWEDAVQYFLVGASTVQVCSAVMQYGYRIIRDLRQGLQDYMEKMGFNEVIDFRGLALPNITRHNDLDRGYRLVARADLDRCVNCGLCYIACSDSGYQAIVISEKRTPTFDAEKCDGCGLCSQVCPVVDCITMVPSSPR